MTVIKISPFLQIYSNASYIFQMKSMFDRTSRKGPKVCIFLSLWFIIYEVW